MQKEITLALNPADAFSENTYRPIVANYLKTGISSISYIRILRRSIDARNRNIKVILQLQVFIDEHSPGLKNYSFKFQDICLAKPVIIIGSGPAGLFAALRLIELGYRPLIFERGKEISDRKRDVALIGSKHIVNPDSNYCFGEGGAGTFSDGKLYTRSGKRGNLQRLYEMFHHHGADESVLYDAHPHIGTDKLPQVIKNIRKTILDYGGTFYFQTKVIDLIVKSDVVKGIKTNKGDNVKAEAVILATGHSARDVYRMLHDKGIAVERKPFAMGVRVEHPQELIDTIQYHGQKNGKYLPAASYVLAEQINGRGVFSFCMCPGGFIVPSATANDEVVVNGMSSSKRNSPFANSGIVVEIRENDLVDYSKYGELGGLMFQQQLESMAWQNGGRSQVAPSQRLGDFVKGLMSSSLPKISYFPGVISSPVHHWLPDFISGTLRKGFEQFDRKMRGFLTNEAVVVGVESRTSSPVRIPRDKDTFQHIQIKGLFPCGEGSGYAGGIASSAIDGENCAEKVAQYLADL